MWVLRSKIRGGGYLGTDHGEGLALGGVDLAGHDAAPWLVLRKAQLPQAAPGPTTQEPHIVGYLESFVVVPESVACFFALANS